MNRHISSSVLGVTCLFAVTGQQALAFVATEESLPYAAPASTFESAGQLSIPRSGQRLIRPTGVPLQQTARESAVSALGDAAEIEADAISGTPFLVSGELSLSLTNRFGSMDALNAWSASSLKSEKNRLALARIVRESTDAYIRENEGTLGLGGLQLRFNTDKFYSDGESTLASYDVLLNGIKVEGATVALRFSQGLLVQVQTKTFGVHSQAEIRGTQNSPQQASALALQTASAVLGPQAKITAGSVQTLIVPKVESQGGKQVYTYTRALKLQAAAANGELFSMVRSLGANEILEWYSEHLTYSGTVSGVVNNRSVDQGQATQGMPYVTTKVGGGLFGGKTYSADVNGTLQVPNAASIAVGLTSAKFKIANQSGKKAQVTGSANLLFDASVNSTLAETTTYYHLHVVQDWAQEIISPKWFKAAVQAKVNIKDFCNAYWDGSTLNFFQAGTKKSSSGKIYDCNNTGEIADVVYHEWGHGLDANTGGIDDRAYSEGIGDIVSMLMTGSADVGPGFFKDGKPVRNIDGDYMYPPKADEREVHREGQIIGAAWFHLLQGLESKYGVSVGRQTAKRLFLKSLYTTNAYTDVYDALLALDAGGANPNAAPNLCVINKAFVRHGLAKAQATCL